MCKILLIEDDEILNAGLCYNLQKKDMIPCPAYSLEEAQKLLKEDTFDLILIDVNLPDGDGFLFAERVLSPKGMPFIFLTAHNLEEEMIGGFRVGADDYITKPFSLGVVMERIQAVLRRCRGEKMPDIYTCGRLSVDFDKRVARKDGVPVALTPTEFELLQLFCKNRNQILTKELLLQSIWDDKGNYVSEHTLSLNISRLRSKIEDEEVRYIKTIYGMGYQWIGEEM